LAATAVETAIAAATVSTTVKAKVAVAATVTAASVAGKGHIERGLPCQDAFEFTDPNKQWIVAAVADGAGSQPHS
jgi:hypothetical protein